MGLLSGLENLGRGALDMFGMSGAYAGTDAKDASLKAWQRSMNASNTAVQRRKDDLVAAGFNPLLAVGDPASSPQATASNPASMVPSSAGAASSNFFQIGVRNAMAKQANSAAAANEANARKANSEAVLNEDIHSAGGPGADVDLKKSQTALNQVSAQVQNEEVKKVVAQTALTGAQTELTVQERAQSIVAVDKLWTEMKNINMDTIGKRAQINLTGAEVVGRDLDNTQKRSVLEWATKMVENDLEKSQLSGDRAAKEREVYSTWLGDLAAKWSVMAQPISSAIGLSK